MVAQSTPPPSSLGKEGWLTRRAFLGAAGVSAAAVSAACGVNIEDIIDDIVDEVEGDGGTEAGADGGTEVEPGPSVVPQFLTRSPGFPRTTAGVRRRDGDLFRGQGSDESGADNFRLEATQGDRAVEIVWGQDLESTRIELQSDVGGDLALEARAVALGWHDDELRGQLGDAALLELHLLLRRVA